MWGREARKHKEVKQKEQEEPFCLRAPHLSRPRQVGTLVLSLLALVYWYKSTHTDEAKAVWNDVMVFVPEVFRSASSDSKMLLVPELLNSGGPPTRGPAVAPGKSARFTCFTSTKVQILTPTRGPAVSPDDEFNGTNANGAGVADGQLQNREDEGETRGFDTSDAEALERQRARKCCVWSKDDVAVGGTSQVFRDANGEWIVGIKVKLNLLQVLSLLDLLVQKYKY